MFHYLNVAVRPGATLLERNSPDPGFGTVEAELVAFDEGRDGRATLIEPAPRDRASHRLIPFGSLEPVPLDGSKAGCPHATPRL